MFGIAFTRKQTLWVFFSTLFFLLVFMSYQVTDPSTGRTVLGNVLFSMFSPVHAMITGSIRTTVGTISDYFNLVNTNKENARLRKEVSDLKVRLAVNQEEKAENDRLRKILALQPKLPYKQVFGEVIGRDARAPLSGTLILNRGSRQGIRPEMPLLSVDGIVGITVVVSPFTSQVQLITDPSSSVGAMLAKNRVAGILAGQGNGICRLRFLPLTVVLNQGDVVVTSGQDSIFPVGLPVGRVVGQVQESQYYKSAEVQPFQNYTSIREVIFLLPSPDQAAPK